MNNVISFNKILFNKNINRSFYFYCLSKDFKLIRFIFLNLFFIIVSILFDSKKDIYEIKKFKYLKYVKNIEEKKKTFYAKNKFNEYYEFNESVLIAKTPKSLIKVPNKKIKIIAYELDKNYDVLLNKFEEDIKQLENIDKLYSNDFSLLKKIKSNKKYYSNNRFLLNIKRIVKIPNYLKIIFAILFISIFLTSISFCYAITILDMRFILSYFEIKLFIMNFIPIFFIITLMYFFTRRIHISFLVTSLLIMALGISNQTKLFYRDDIVKFEDLFIIKEAAIMTTRYDIFIKWYTKFFVFLLILMFFILKKYFSKMKLKFWKQILGIILIVIAVFFTYNSLYQNETIYNNLGNEGIINKWIATRQYQIRGLIYPFVYTIKDVIDEEPKNYNEIEIENELNKYNYEDIPNDKKVNIISIMLEAYNDFTKFNVIDFNEDIYEKFHLIQDKSISGNLVTSIFGGGTIETERNFLTGYYNFPSFRKQTNSYVWYFKEQGYRTEANHPIYGAFYNRASVNPNLGFDDYYNYENRYSAMQQNFVRDDIFFKDIISGYEKAKEENVPYFNFSVTYQNHGPYNTNSYEGKQYYFDQGNMTTSTFNAINEYFSGIEDTNNSIYELIKYFEKEEEPVIIILFGDHNPFLESTGYQELGINMDLSTIEGFLNYYETPYIIYGNDSAKKVFNVNFEGKGNTISPVFLMNELFDYIGFKGNKYLQYMSNLKEKIDVINPYYYKYNNEYIYGDSNELIQNYKLMNYYVSRNFKYNN